MRFLILGATGMAGHTITLYLQERGHDVTAFSRKPIHYCNCKNIISDAKDFVKLSRLIETGNYDAVVNCIGILNKDAEKQKAEAVLLNSYLPHFLSEITKDLQTKVIHLSTDCVFSGEKGNYTEKDSKDGKDFYAKTKALGELEDEKNLTFRTSIIGPDLKKEGIGLFNWFMKQENEINGYTKVFWSGVTTLTLAKAIEKAVQSDLKGLYHLTNNTKINKYKLLNLFNKYFRNNEVVIRKYDKIHIDKSLVDTRKDFDFKIPSYENMIKEMKNWIILHKDLYPHYF